MEDIIKKMKALKSYTPSQMDETNAVKMLEDMGFNDEQVKKMMAVVRNYINIKD